MGGEERERTTLGMTADWIDLIIQSVRCGSSVYRSGRACSGKNKFANKREAGSVLSLRGNRTTNLGSVNAAIF